MRWDEERYVRLYKRDTADWLALSFDAQALFVLLLRKVNISGYLELGRHGPKAIAMVLQQVALWETRLKPALDELLADGCVRIDGTLLVMPNFVAAQSARMSDKLRSALHRERKDYADTARKADTQREADATNRDAGVTSGHTASHGVTPLAFSLEPLTRQKKDPPLPPENARGAQIGKVVDGKAQERPPCSPLNGNGTHEPQLSSGTVTLARAEQPRLRKRKRPETLAQRVKLDAEHEVDERSKALFKAMEYRPMSEADALAYANTRWPTGPPNERVVALAFEAYAMRAGAAPGGTT